MADNWDKESAYRRGWTDGYVDSLNWQTQDGDRSYHNFFNKKTQIELWAAYETGYKVGSEQG